MESEWEHEKLYAGRKEVPEYVESVGNRKGGKEDYRNLYLRSGVKKAVDSHLIGRRGLEFDKRDARRC